MKGIQQRKGFGGTGRLTTMEGTAVSIYTKDTDQKK